MKTYYVYILSSRSRTLYTGVTSNLPARLYMHRQQKTSFAARYHCNRLVYYESTNLIQAAIDRETQIKRWTRAKKLRLIEQMNPGWDDLAELLGISPGLGADSSTSLGMTRALRSE